MSELHDMDVRSRHGLNLGSHSKKESIAKSWQVVVLPLTAEWLPEWVDADRHPLQRILRCSLHYAHASHCCLLTKVCENSWRGTLLTQKLQTRHPGRVCSKTWDSKQRKTVDRLNCRLCRIGICRAILAYMVLCSSKSPCALHVMHFCALCKIRSHDVAHLSTVP